MFFPNRMLQVVAKGIYNWRPQYIVRVPFFVAGTASAEEAVESLECGLYSVVCGLLRSAESVGSRVWSVECSAKCGVWSV